MHDSNFTVASLMRPPALINENGTLENALEQMIREKRNSLTVVDNDGKLVGAINAIDIIKAVLPDYLEEDAVAARFADETILREDTEKVRGVPITSFMATDIPVIARDTSITEAAVTAIASGRGRITIVDENHRPIGILTRTEIKQVIGSYLGFTNHKS